jgi:N-acetylmuramoyl-L-alanine amidase
MRPINLIVIHCAATPSGKAIACGETTAAHAINAWHAARGFQRQPQACSAFNPTLPNIGYHYVIDVTGEVLTGRAEAEVGAHAAGFNANSIGICMVGGVEREGRFTPAQWKALAKLVLGVAHVHRIPLAAPRRIGTADDFTLLDGVCGHRDLSPDTDGSGRVEPREWLKTCPGFDVQSWLQSGLEPLAQHVYLEA